MKANCAMWAAVLGVMATAACGSSRSVATGGLPSTTGLGVSDTPSSATTALTGAVAIWSVDPSDPLTSASTSFTAHVTRVGCNDGNTGLVRQPDVSSSPTEIVVRFSVEPRQDVAAPSCLGNDSVPVVVHLSEAIGDRRLIDGACLAGGEAATTALCKNGATRWPP